MKFTKRILAFLAVIAICLTGCSTGDTSWVYEYAGSRMPAGVYISYQMRAFNEAQGKLYEQNADNSDFIMPEKSADLLKLSLDDVTVEEWVSTKAREYSRSYYVINRECERLGVALSDYDRDAIQAEADELWVQAGADIEKAYGIAKSSWISFQQNETLRSMLFEKLYGEGGERAVPDDTLKEIFARDYAKAAVLTVSKPTSTDADFEAAVAERKALAEGYLRRLEAGESMENIEYDYRVEIAADEAVKAAVTKKEPGTISTIYHRDDSAYYQTGLVESVFESPVGSPVMSEAELYFFLILRKDILTDDPANLDSYRPIIIANEKADEFESWIANEAAVLEVSINQPAIDRYKVSRLQA